MSSIRQLKLTIIECIGDECPECKKGVMSKQGEKGAKCTKCGFVVKDASSAENERKGFHK